MWRSSAVQQQVKAQALQAELLRDGGCCNDNNNGDKKNAAREFVEQYEPQCTWKPPFEDALELIFQKRFWKKDWF